MSLSPIPVYWLTRKEIVEKTMAQRRDREAKQRQLWDSAARDFDLLQLKAVKHNSWTSNSLYQYCSESYQAQLSKQLKAKRLEERREKLANLLQQEEARYEAELKELRKFHRRNISEPPSRKKIEKPEESCMEDKEIVKENDEALLPVADYEKKPADDNIVDEDSKLTMLQHLQELKAKEAEMTKLKKLQEQLQLQRWRLEQVEEERKRNDKKILNQEYSRSLKRQYKFQLQKRANEILEELKRDVRVLQCIADENLADGNSENLKRNKVRSDYLRFKKILEDQMALEEYRKAESQTLFNEEAGRLWRTREAEWAREHAVRKKLMQEVTEGLKRQIEEHMAENLKQQQLLVETRERLIEEVELLKQSQKSQHEMELQRKEAWKEQITSQIREKEDKEMSQIRNSLEEVSRRRIEGPPSVNGENPSAPQLAPPPERTPRSNPANSTSSQAQLHRRVAWM